jgi:cytochrome c biogenesis protein CcmG/thiol:disulfide interchange protein DsbE
MNTSPELKKNLESGEKPMDVDIPEETNVEAATRIRPRWGRILVWVGLLTLLGILAWALIRNRQGPVSIGSQVPDFTLTTFEGENIKLSDLKGKVVVLNFWASWCKPCEEEAADLEAAWRHYQPRGDVVFLGVDYVDTEPEARAYLEKFDITYTNGPDLGTRISQAFRITGVPETYTIDQEGLLRHMQFGPFPNLESILKVVDPLLSQ